MQSPLKKILEGTML